MMESSRREFLCQVSSAAAAAITTRVVTGAEKPHRSLSGVIGFTTGSLSYQREKKILTALTLPKFVRDELGMKLIDFNTRWLTSSDEKYVREVRGVAEEAGCFYTNLKVNHKFGDLYAKDASDRRKAMTSARQLILAARWLGARWIRFPVPRPVAETRTATLSAHRELASIAKDHGVQLLVENNGWMRSEPDSVASLVKIIGSNAAPGPDTGNWNDNVRYEGIARSFPRAATCDFKVFDLTKDGQHQKYDIKRCFDVAWKAGFRGPWALEHWNENLGEFAREMRFLRDQLSKWIAEVE